MGELKPQSTCREYHMPCRRISLDVKFAACGMVTMAKVVVTMEIPHTAKPQCDRDLTQLTDRNILRPPDKNYRQHL